MNTIWTVFCVADFLLWLVMALSDGYVLFFSLASLLPRRVHGLVSEEGARKVAGGCSFLVLYPAYNEDTVIRSSVETFLKQDYPRDRFQLVVISDHMSEGTNAWLSRQPITLLTPKFDKSSKAKALQFAIRETEEVHKSSPFTHVVILDADNIVKPDFLSRLNVVCCSGSSAIQCHRTAKNNDNDVAALDGLSEEINNSIFRRGHNRVGLSSALIGSGMCFGYEWFANHVDSLSTAGEDKELEAMLLWERVHVHYAEDIPVMDEKVSGGDNFQRQRLRWMTAQVQCLRGMLPRLPRAIATLRIDYIDKTLQQALIPRSILLLAIPFMAVFVSATQLFTIHYSHYTLFSAKWWLLLLALVVALLVAIPRQLRTRAILAKAVALPSLVLRMLRNLMHIKTNNTDFLHTEHGK